MAILIPRIIQAKQILRRSFSNGSSNASTDIPKGYFAVYVGEQEKKRFVVPVSLLRQPTFQELLRQAEEEFGYNHPMGGLTIPCSEDIFTDLASRLGELWLLYSKLCYHGFVKQLTTRTFYSLWDGDCCPSITKFYLGIISNHCILSVSWAETWMKSSFHSLLFLAKRIFISLKFAFRLIKYLIHRHSCVTNLQIIDTMNLTICYTSTWDHELISQSKEEFWFDHSVWKIVGPHFCFTPFYKLPWR